MVLAVSPRVPNAVMLEAGHVRLRALPLLERAAIAQGAQLAGPDVAKEDDALVGVAEVLGAPIGDAALAALRDAILHLHHVGGAAVIQLDDGAAANRLEDIRAVEVGVLATAGAGQNLLGQQVR